MMNSIFGRRFQELSDQFSVLPFHTNDGFAGLHVKAGDWKRWATSAQSVILAVFGEGSPHYQNFVQSFSKCGGWDYDVLELRGIFLSAKDDFDNGYVFNVDLRVSGEVFGDFIGLAKEALAEGHKEVAAVLACASLEDALKKFAASNGLEVQGKSMQDVINSLKTKGLVAGAQKTLLDTMPRVRNLALHADWDKLSEPEINSVIGFVEQFLITKFSGS